MEYWCMFVSRKLFMVCAKILTPPGSTHWEIGIFSLLNFALKPASIGKKVIALCYFDDLIFGTRNENDLVCLNIKLHSDNLHLEQEDDAVRFLGIHIKCDPRPDFSTWHRKSWSSLPRKLMVWMLELQIYYMYLPKSFLPNMCMESLPLAISTKVVGIPLYLASTIFPDITYAVNCAKR